MKKRITVEGDKDIMGEDRLMNSSTATTVSSESKQVDNSSNVYTSSCILEAETDLTSSPSEMLNEPDRKCTESPIDSDRAVYGSGSIHSESFESSAEHNDVSFRNPVNDMEAQFINDKVKKANTTMKDIDLHPEVHYRDHGSSFQVSARPKESPIPKPTLAATMKDIDLRPEVHYRDHGSSFQVFARPKKSPIPKSTLAATMKNIDLRPEVHYRDHGSSFQVSARPKESPFPNPALTATMQNIDLRPEVQYRDHGSSFQVSARPKESPIPKPTNPRAIEQAFHIVGPVHRQ